MKEYRDKELKNLMFLLLFLFLIWCTPIFNDIDINTSYDKYHILLNTVESALVSATLSCATVLFDCLISPNLKDKLVGLFFIPRSGETIFSYLREGKIKDPRFFTVDAVVFYADIIQSLPGGKTERHKFENTEWYQIYQRHQKNGQISQSQRDYLMCRDLYIEALGFLIVYILAICVFPSIIVFSRKFLIAEISLAIAFNICAHLKMKRFVTTVIAVDIAKQRNDKKSISTQ